MPKPRPLKTLRIPIPPHELKNGADGGNRTHTHKELDPKSSASASSATSA